MKIDIQLANEINPFEQDFAFPKEKDIEISLIDRIDLYGKVIGVLFVAVGVKAFMISMRTFRQYPSLTPVMGFTSLTLITTGYMWITKNSYHNPEVRKKHRLEFENGQITIEDFIQKHSWERIVHFGFHVADEAEPLITKKHFSQFINRAAKDLDFGFNDQFDLEDIIYPYKKTALWQCLDYGLFSEEQKKNLKQEFLQRVSTIPSYSLVKNWGIITNQGWDKYLTEASQSQIKECINSYANLKQLYNIDFSIVMHRSEDRPWTGYDPRILLLPLYVLYNLSKLLHEITDSEYSMLSKDSAFLIRYHHVHKKRLVLETKQRLQKRQYELKELLDSINKKLKPMRKLDECSIQPSK